MTITIKDDVIFEEEIKKSRFICHLKRVTTEEAAREFINSIKKQHHKANHNVSAFTIGDHQEIQRSSDDGEPSGTAGVPMLEILKKRELTNLVAVVTRYFGGIKLGAGGLTRAYAGAAQAVVDQMILLPYVPMAQVQILAEFATEAQCRYIVDSLNGSIDNVAYSKQVLLTVTLAEADINNLKESLAVSGRVLESP